MVKNKVDSRMSEQIRKSFTYHTDRQIADKNGITIYQVRYHRSFHLGVMHKTVKPSFRQIIRRELIALECLCYNGIMKDSADKRIEFLKQELKKFD